MSGDTTSSGSSGSESESGTGGKGASDETLKALEGLKQSMQELKGEVEKNASSLDTLKNNFSNLEKQSSSSGIEITEPIFVQKAKDTIKVPDGAQGVFVSVRAGYYDCHIIYDGFDARVNYDGGPSNLGYTKDFVAIPSSIDTITVSYTILLERTYTDSWMAVSFLILK